MTTTPDILSQIGTLIGGQFSNRFLGLVGRDVYSEITYDNDGNISRIETYADDTKAKLLKVKTFTFSSGSLTQILVTDGTNTKLTQTLTYGSNGSLANIEKDFA